MGMFKRHKTVYNNTIVSSNPDPRNFRIKECEHIGNYWLSKINYPDAKNFEGDKILLTEWNPRNAAVIDPHFEKNAGILARFEPTEKGWKLAKKFAKLLAYGDMNE